MVVWLQHGYGFAMGVVWLCIRGVVVVWLFAVWLCWGCVVVVVWLWCGCEVVLCWLLGSCGVAVVWLWR